jgi:hypothetical protein
MKNRIIDNWKTSVTGFIIFGFACYLLYSGKIDTTGYAAMVVLSGLLVRAKDSLIGAEAK